MNEKKSRRTLNALISNYGHQVVSHGDHGLNELENVIRGSTISREELAALVAFAVRRLHNKKSGFPTKITLN